MTSAFDLNKPAADPALWSLDPEIVFLNHGSFGSCPTPVLAYQQALRDQMERRPVHFFVRELEALLDEGRAAIAEFVGADEADVVFVPNATAGVNTVLRSLEFKPGDELLVTDHEYNACRNALDYAGGRAGAAVVVAPIPFPLKSPDDAVGAVLNRVTDRTRLVLVDHITSQTGMVLPIATLAKELAQRGVDLLVDGAHAPGMIPLNLRELGAAYYTGNCHKWICAPKGAAFLFVRRDCQAAVHPLIISHGANSPRTDRSRFLLEFGWTGTWDPTAMLSVSEALRVMGSLLEGGWEVVMARNRRLAQAARDLLCTRLRIEVPCPEDMIGSLASVPLPDSTETAPPTSPLYTDPLQDRLRNEFSIEVPIVPWPAPPKRVLRVSAQLYNSLPQYHALADALVALGMAR